MRKSGLVIAGWTLAGLFVGWIVLGSLILGSGFAEIADVSPWVGELGLLLVLAALVFLIGRTVAKNSAPGGLALGSLSAGVLVVPLVIGLQGMWVTALEIAAAAAFVLMCGFLGQRTAAHPTGAST